MPLASKNTVTMKKGFFFKNNGQLKTEYGVKKNGRKALTLNQAVYGGEGGDRFGRVSSATPDLGATTETDAFGRQRPPHLRPQSGGFEGPPAPSSGRRLSPFGKSGASDGGRWKGSGGVELDLPGWASSTPGAYRTGPGTRRPPAAPEDDGARWTRLDPAKTGSGQGGRGSKTGFGETDLSARPHLDSDLSAPSMDSPNGRLARGNTGLSRTRSGLHDNDASGRPRLEHTKSGASRGFGRSQSAVTLGAEPEGQPQGGARRCVSGLSRGFSRSPSAMTFGDEGVPDGRKSGLSRGFSRSPSGVALGDEGPLDGARKSGASRGFSRSPSAAGFGDEPDWQQQQQQDGGGRSGLSRGFSRSPSAMGFGDEPDDGGRKLGAGRTLTRGLSATSGLGDEPEAQRTRSRATTRGFTRGKSGLDGYDDDDEDATRPIRSRTYGQGKSMFDFPDDMDVQREGTRKTTLMRAQSARSLGGGHELQRTGTGTFLNGGFDDGRPAPAPHGSKTTLSGAGNAVNAGRRLPGARGRDEEPGGDERRQSQTTARSPQSDKWVCGTPGPGSPLLEGGDHDPSDAGEKRSHHPSLLPPEQCERVDPDKWQRWRRKIERQTYGAHYDLTCMPLSSALQMDDPSQEAYDKAVTDTALLRTRRHSDMSRGEVDKARLTSHSAFTDRSMRMLEGRGTRNAIFPETRHTGPEWKQVGVCSCTVCDPSPMRPAGVASHRVHYNTVVPCAKDQPPPQSLWDLGNSKTFNSARMVQTLSHNKDGALSDDELRTEEMIFTRSIGRKIKTPRVGDLASRRSMSENDLGTTAAGQFDHDTKCWEISTTRGKGRQHWQSSSAGPVPSGMALVLDPMKHGPPAPTAISSFQKGRGACRGHLSDEAKRHATHRNQEIFRYAEDSVAWQRPTNSVAGPGGAAGISSSKIWELQRGHRVSETPPPMSRWHHLNNSDGMATLMNYDAMKKSFDFEKDHRMRSEAKFADICRHTADSHTERREVAKHTKASYGLDSARVRNELLWD